MLTERQPFDLELNEYIFLNLQKVFFVAEFFFFKQFIIFSVDFFGNKTRIANHKFPPPPQMVAVLFFSYLLAIRITS